MLPKKNPDVEIGRNSGLYFAIGLNIMLFLSWQALEYKTFETEDVDIGYVNMQAQTEEEIPIVQYTQTLPPPPPPPAIVTESVEIVEDEEIIEETIFESTEVTQTDAIVEYGDTDLGVSDVQVAEVAEDVEVPFSVIENVPVFPGCEGKSKAATVKCFNDKMLEHVKNNFHYPEAALDLAIGGRVTVVFIIDQKGYITGIRSRGPDKILEKEAERIVSLLPKMKPGTQRGRPVKVNYAVPIVFKYSATQ
ncbi:MULTISPECIES: energy transducer TonB [Aestuariibaculum]|uniref:Energy transducer TonB n=1 Tax=Aestuariibaculum lutulentum TaxID=2920935 RepID=A0ABS9RHG6_9FLAO|nr:MULTISPECIES: energy transducer TonB [Aestuariibaculum]MCH4552392.1 energy transducer TonB [Aestuariibaculum lutulentum]MCR8668509.1 energy transducer TonB [Aestuariibaculum sp. M13]